MSSCAHATDVAHPPDGVGAGGQQAILGTREVGMERHGQVGGALLPVQADAWEGGWCDPGSAE